MGLRDRLAAAWRWFNNPQPAASAVRPASAVRESFGITPMGYDPDANLSATQGGSAYYRTLTSQINRDLAPLTQDRQREIAGWLYDTNPLAKRMVEYLRDYVLGEGVEVRAATDTDGGKAHEAEQDVLTDLWTGPINRMPRLLGEYVLELGLWGEQCWTATVNPVNAAIRLGYIDPARIAAVLVDPIQPQFAADIVLKSDKGGNDGPRYRVIRLDADPLSASYGRLMGLQTHPDRPYTTTYIQGDETKPYAGMCFYWGVNKPVSATRGRSDLLTVADIVDAIDKIIIGEVDRQELLKAFVWDVTCTNMDETAILAKAASITAPQPGSVRVHNEKEVWAAVSPDLQSYDTAKALQTMIEHAAAGIGLPKTWLSSTDDVNRASAQELGEPAFKRLTARQDFVRMMLEEVSVFALDQAELAGLLSRPAAPAGTLPAPWGLTVTMPEMRPKDLTSGTKALADGANALATLRADHVIDEQTHQEAAVLLLGTTIGQEIDLEAMRERLEEEEVERKAEEEAMMAQLGTASSEPEPPTNDNGRQMPARMAVVARGGER